MKFILFREGEKPNPLKILLFIPLLVVVIPLAALASLFHYFRQRNAAHSLLSEWPQNEKYLLLSYYPGSVWRKYIEDEVLAKWGKYIITMDWSEDQGRQVDKKYAALANKAFCLYALDYDFPSPQTDDDMREEYQVVLLALYPGGKVETFSTYPMTPHEIMKYEKKLKGDFEDNIKNCISAWKV